MRLYSFFKLLNHKIKQLENTAQNPFNDKYKKTMTIIWVEDINDTSTSEHS